MRHYSTNVIIREKQYEHEKQEGRMKKRIGSKLYNTETAIPVLPEQNLFRQSWGQTFFFFDGNSITPIEYKDAELLIRESGNQDAIKLLTRKADKQGDTNIRISAHCADRLSAYCRENQLTQKQVIENFINTLPIDEN